MQKNQLFTTDRLILRNWQNSDKEPFFRMSQDPIIMKFLGGLRTREQSAATVDGQISLGKNGEPAFWAAELKSARSFIGFIGVKAINFDASFAETKPGYEIGWRLARDHWGKGYATEGARAALDYAFSNWNMPMIHSFTVPANLASQNVMRKIGMQRVIDGDFDHPSLDEDDPLLRHVLYEIKSA